MKEGRFPQGRWLAAYFAGPRRPAILAALIALGILLTIWWGSRLWYKESLLIHERQDAMADLAPHGNALTTAIDRRLALLKGLRAFVEVHASAPTLEKEFKVFAAELHAGTRGIRNFAIAPGGINRFVYPLAGNETVPGHNLLQDPRPNVRADVSRAIQSRRITLSGPYELRQGGLGLVARLALYQKESFWGLVAMVLDVAPILEEAGLQPNTGGLNLALRNGAGGVFFGERSVFAEKPVVYRVKLAEGSWELAAAPGGWGVSTRQALVFFDGSTLAIVFLLTGLAYLVVNRDARLALGVRQRTQEIADINKQLEMDIAVRKRVEEELRLVQQGLETRVQERTRELAKANDELQLEIRGRKQIEQALRESERRFRAIFNQTYQLTGLLKPDGTLLETNETSLAFRRLKREDVVGRPFWETPWWDISAEAQDRLKAAAAAAARGDFVRYEVDLLGPDGSVVTFDFSLKPLTDDNGQVTLLIPEGRDITDLKRIENETRLMLTVPQEVAIARDFHAAVVAVLRRVCEATGWDFGEAWIPRSDGSLLECRAVWHTSAKELDRFRELSASVTFAPGVGLPGRVWVSREPEWVRDISANPAYPRAALAKEIGLRAAVGIPILADEEVIAILTFFMFRPREEDERLIEVLSGVATQLGLVFQRKQAEEALREARDELEIRVQDRTSELAKVNEALEADISERKRAEEALRESEERWRLMSDSLPVLISYIDSEERYQLNNAAYEAWFGIPKEAFKGRKVRDVIGEAAYVRVKPHINAALAGQPRAFEGELKYRDLGTRHVHIDYVPRRSDDAGILGFYALIQDITERKRAEEEVRRSGTWLRSLIDATQDAVVSIDRQGRVILFNPAAERIFGYSKAEIQGQKVNVLMAEPYATEHDGYIERYEKTGEARAIGRIRTVEARRKNGETFPIELSVTKVATAESEEVHYAALIRDITEKIRLQQRLIENERLAAIGTTAAKLAHEIGNPLNGMYITAQLLERRLSKLEVAPDESVIAGVRTLHKELNRLHQLLDDYRALSRREKYSFQLVSLAPLVDEAIQMETPYYESLGIRLEQEIPRDLPLIHGNSEKITQALLNLFKNAVEAMPHGGTLTIRGYKSTDGVVLEIKDTGTGIPPGLDIFEPFITTKSSGTGLGLVVVRQILTAHGTTISYTTEPGKGTTFYLRFPLELPAG